MRIPGDIPKITGIYDKQKSVNKIEKTSAVSSKKDVVSISNQAKDFQTVQKALKNVPDIRQNKVNELMVKYESGQYNASGKDIADNIVKSIFDKKV